MAEKALLFGRVISRQGKYAAIMARHANFFHFFPALFTPCMPFIPKEEKMRPAEAFPVR
jgi:hypothetical protein